MRPATLSTRLGLAMGLLSAVLVIGLALLAYAALDRQLDQRARHQLGDKLERARQLLAGVPDSTALARHPHLLLDLVSGHDDLGLSVLDVPPRQQPLLGSGAPVPADLVERLASTDTTVQQRWSDASGTEQLSVGRSIRLGNGTPVLLLVSLDRGADTQLLGAFRDSAMAGVPFLLLLVGLGAWYAVQRGLSPLRRFRKVAARVSTDDLSHRIALEKLPLELREVAHALNLMLNRLDGGVQQLTQFSDDLAHELRSPLGNLLGKAQVALARERSGEEYQNVLVSGVEELERLTRIVQDMLFLAQVNQAPAPFQRLALHDEADKVAELFRLAAEEKGVEIAIAGRGWVLGERLMVQRAISNLLSNAIRHTPGGGLIGIRIDGGGEGVCLSVSNPGAGIDAQHLPHLFERFYRVDASRARSEGGTGLGLSIVQSIMTLHGGAARVSSRAGGPTCFSLAFPGGT